MPDLAFSLPRSIPFAAHPVWSGMEMALTTGAAHWPCLSGDEEPGWCFGCTVEFFLIQIFGIFKAWSRGFKCAKVISAVGRWV